MILAGHGNGVCDGEHSADVTNKECSERWPNAKYRDRDGEESEKKS